MSTTVLISLALSLLATLVLESGFYLLICKLRLVKLDKKDLLLLVLVNVITNPVVVLSYWLVVIYTSWDIRLVLILLELFAVITEGWYYKKYGNNFRRPFLFSLAANVFSYGVGAVVQMLI